MPLKTITSESEGFMEDRKSRFLARLVPIRASGEKSESWDSQIR